MTIQEKIDEINRRLFLLDGLSEIVIWGAGVHTLKLFEKTKLLSYNIGNIVDIDESKQGEQYFGYVVKKPSDIDWGGVNAAVISVFGRNFQIINSLVNDLKFTGQIIVLYEENETIPFYKLYDEKSQQVYGGDYKSWADAAADCVGYSDDTILTKVADSVDRVLAGEAEYERDSWLFYEQKFIYRLCAAILKCAVQNKNLGVTVLDIGGSLGSAYFQNRKYLRDVHNLQYIIAEQESFADYGHKKLEDETLKFINSGDDYNKLGKVDIILMSGSLQYIYPYNEVVMKILKIKPRYIIIDRILIGERMRICKQVVPKEIYDSNYPVMIFSEEEIYALFGNDYELREKDISSVPEEAHFADGDAQSMYYVFERKQG